MKKFIKSRLFTFILGAVIFGSIGVVSAYTIFANDIGYTPKDSTWKKSNGEDITNVKDAIDELYNKANSNRNNTVCMLLSGTKNTVSAKYHCDLGDEKLRNFYVLSVNGDKVKLIMEKNITDEILVNDSRMLSWNDAMVYFNEGHSGYNIKQTWLTKVEDVDLPSAQEIANAGGISGFNVATTTVGEYLFGGSANAVSNYLWLYNFTRGNGYNSNDSSYPYGYWTKNLVAGSNDSLAWRIDWGGVLDTTSSSTNSTTRGVRPVITLSKSKLSG